MFRCSFSTVNDIFLFYDQYNIRPSVCASCPQALQITEKRFICQLFVTPPCKQKNTTAVKPEASMCCIPLMIHGIPHGSPVSTFLVQEVAYGNCSWRTNLDCLGCLQRLLRWDAHLPLPQKLLGEVGDVSSCDGNVLYTAADYIAFSLRDTQE